MTLHLLWAVVVLLPLLCATVLAATRPDGGRTSAWLHRWSVRLAQLALLPALALTLLPPDDQGTVAAVEVPWLMLGATVALDPAGRALLLVAVVLYGSALTAVSWRHTRRAAELEAFLLVSFVGNLGVYAATDAVTFYLAFAVMSFAAAGLVLHERTAVAHRAARVYLTLTVASEAAVLGALILTVGAGGMALADAPAAVAASPHTPAIVGLLVVGFGVKAGLVPLHLWLPLAHPAAPPAASAVLSGAMVKAGLIGWLRFLPLGEVELRTWGMVVVLLALAGALGAAVVGVGQRDPKVVLAYSTVSQTGYLSAVVGISLVQPALAPAAMASAVVYAVHHGLAKGALFLGVPVWKHHRTNRSRWVVVGGLTAASLAVVGAPFTSGALGKYATKTAVEGAALWGLDLVQVLPLVATGSTLLLVRFTWLLLHTEPDPLPVQSDPELPAWLVIVLASLVVPRAVTEAWVPVTGVPQLDPVTLWDAAWPILLGLVPAALVWWRARSGTGGRHERDRAVRAVPAGDLVVPAERVVALTGQGLGRAGSGLGTARDRGLERLSSGWADWRDRAAGPLGSLTRSVESYRGSGVLVLVLLGLVVLVQVVGR